MVTRCRVWCGGAARGFSLVEVLVALALVGGALAGLGQLIGISVRANVSAQAATVSAVLAEQKMAQLRADVDRAPVGGSLQQDVDGFVDFLDAQGRAVADPAAGVLFVRRWLVGPAPFDPVRTRVLRVRVTHVSGSAAGVPTWPGLGRDESRLLTMVTARER